MTKKIDAIIFDMDGTLVSSSQVIFEGYQHALVPWGITLDKVQIESVRAKKADKLFEDWGLSPEESTHAVERMNTYCQENANRSIIFDGIFSMLVELQKLRIPMAVWTGRNTQAAHQLLHVHKIDHFFHPVLGSSCVDKNKPNPEGIERISRQWKIAAENILMVGDHDHDIKAGHAAGCQTVRARWRESNPSHQQHSTSDWDCNSPLELLNLVKSLRSDENN